MCKYYKTCGNWENSKLCENTPPFGRHVCTQFLVFPISTLVDITTVNRNRMVWKVGGVLEYVFDPCLEGSHVK